MDKLTTEQQIIVSAFSRERLLKVNAFAGTGKTTTLLAIAKSTKDRGIYLAFNKAIAEEVKRKSSNKKLDARTTHGLAILSFWDKGYSQEKLTTNLQGNRIAHELEYGDLSLDGKVTLKPRSLGFMVTTCLKNFCQSSDQRPNRTHVPIFGRMHALCPMYQLKFKDYIIKLAVYLWERMIDPKDPFPLGHDGYLKLWSLNCPQLPFDYILLDEAQDTNEAVLSVLLSQASKVVFVGDRHQQIYEWRGAVNAMSKVQNAFETHLTQTFRFGDAIADCANQALAALGEKVELKGNPNIHSNVLRNGDSITFISRTNAGVLENVIRLHKGKHPVNVLGGTVEMRLLLEDVERLKNGNPAATHDLFGFASWKEVCEFSESDEGQSLRSFVKLVENHGEKYLLMQISKCTEVIGENTKFVSTAHKAKGREWDSVELGSDFLLSQDKRSLRLENSEETRLLYVSATRARSKLILPDNLYQLLAGVSPIGNADSVPIKSGPALLTNQAQFKKRSVPDLPDFIKPL
jgi:hypothetical protein